MYEVCPCSSAYIQASNAFQGAGACSACHLAPATALTEGDIEEFPPVYGSTPAHKSLVDREDWTLTGHGRTTAQGNYAQSNNPPANFPAPTQTVEPCYYCHAPDTALYVGGASSKHTDIALGNPFRLVNTSGGTNPNGACLVCHQPSSPGFDPDSAANAAYAPINRTTSKAISADPRPPVGAGLLPHLRSGSGPRRLHGRWRVPSCSGTGSGQQL